MARLRVAWLVPALSVLVLATWGLGTAAQTEGSGVYPGREWAPIPPERSDFSAAKLEQAKSYFEKIGGDACVVVEGGYVVAAWGDVSKPIPNRSIRKSYLNSLLGIEFGKGRLKLDATLEELGIDDRGELTQAERQARVRNLLSGTSGVFHEAAYESKEQKGARPPRGSFKPGAFFYYNNWDFNAVGHLYSRIAETDIFEAFRSSIAEAIGMQDFSLENTSYEYDEVSDFPAYNIKSSARDDARFGYLYLRNGKWRDRQIIPEAWIRMSSTKQVETGEHYYYDYGFLWWVDQANGHFFARGNSGQYLAVLPDQDMVIVFRADPGSVLDKWLGRRVKPQESFVLISKILQARTGD